MTEALARLERGRGAWSWVIDICPYCGKKHTHGGGPIEGDPRELLGARAAHCKSVQPEIYILVEEPASPRASTPQGWL